MRSVAAARRWLPLVVLTLGGCFVDDKLLTGGGGGRSGVDMATRSADLTATPDDLATGGVVVDMAPACDDFSADAIGSSPAGWTIDSGVWNVVAAGGGHGVQQMMAPGGAGNLWLARTGALAWTDVTISATVTIANINEDDCVLARYQSIDDYYALCLVSGNKWTVQHSTAGQRTSLGNGAFVYANGQSHTLTLGAHGTTLSATVDGVRKMDFTDAALTRGAVGLGTGATSTFTSVCVSMP